MNTEQKKSIDLKTIKHSPYQDIIVYFRNFIKNKSYISCFKNDEKEVYTFEKDSEYKNILSLDFSEENLKIYFYTEKLNVPKMYKFSFDDIREFLNGSIVTKNNAKFIDFFVNISMYKALLRK